MNIHQRLLEVMKEVSYVQKDQKKIDGKYTAVRHDDVVAKVRPALLKQGILCTSSITECRLSKEQVQSRDGTRAISAAFVTMMVRLTNADKPEDFVEGSFCGQGDDFGDKAVGKATSYAFKYALLKMLMLETGDDADNDAFVERVVRPLPKPSPPPPPAGTAAPKPTTSTAAPGTMLAAPKLFEPQDAPDAPATRPSNPNHELWRTKAQDAYLLVKAERGVAVANAQIKDCHTHRDRLSALNELLHIEDN